MDREVRMVTFVGKEWGDPFSGTWGIVVSEFCKQEQGIPAILLIIAKYPQVLFQGLIGPFGLTVTFRMMKWSFMSSAFPRERKNRETNSEPRSEVTCSGTPCLEKTCMMNNVARSSDIQ